MATDPLSNFRSSPFVSQYKGLPIDAFQQSATVLQNRAIQNKDQMDKLDMLAYETAVYGNEDEAVKQAQIKKIRDEQERIAATGAYERSADLVRMQGKEFAQNTQLNSARSNARNIAASQANASKYSPQQQAALQQRIQAYSGVGEGDEFGKFNVFSEHQFYEDVDFNEKINEFVKDWKANSQEWVSNAQKAGYITSGGTEQVTEEEVRNAAMMMLQSDPKYRRALNDEARYKLYEATGDINAMVADPSTVIGTRTLADGTEENVTALQAAMETYVEPYAQRESYRKTKADMKTDGNFGLKLDMQSMAGRSIIQGSAINPYEKLTVDNWKEVTGSQQLQLKSLKDQLNTIDPETNPTQYSQVQNQIDAIQSQYNTLQQIQEEYRANLADISPEDSKALAFHEKIQDISLERQGDYFFKDPEKANRVLDAYKEVYGQEAYDALGVGTKERKNMASNETFTMDVVDNLTPILKAGAKGKRLANKTYWSNNDFNDYLESQSERFGETPTVILFNKNNKADKDLMEDARSMVLAGNIKIDASTSSDPNVRNFIAAVADELIISGIDAQDGRLNINVPQIDLTADKYKNLDSDVIKAGEELMEPGKNNLYITPVGADYKTKFISSLQREAEVQLQLGNQYEANQAIQLLGTFNQQLDANNWDGQISRAIAQPDIKQNIVAGKADISIQVSPIDNKSFIVYDDKGQIITAENSNKPRLFSRADVDQLINEVNK
jgi:hypothetical protein